MAVQRAAEAYPQSPSEEGTVVMGNENRLEGQQGRPQTRESCRRCGSDPHLRDPCPAKEARCFRCAKEGHFAKVCRTYNNVCPQCLKSHARDQCPAKESVCFECDKKGHFEQACRLRSPGGASARPVHKEEEDRNKEEPAGVSGDAAPAVDRSKMTLRQGSERDVDPPMNNLRLDWSLRPETVLSRGMSGETANRWFERFEAHRDWNQVALWGGNGAMKRQVLVDCLDPDLASALLMDTQVTPDTPINREAGCLARLRTFFTEKTHEGGVKENGIGIPHWEVPERLLDVSRGAEGFLGLGPGSSLPTDTSRMESLDTARSQIMEQLEQSFRNLAPELQGLEGYNDPSQGRRNPGHSCQILPPQYRCQKHHYCVPELRAVEGGDGAVSQEIWPHAGEERQEALPESQRHGDGQKMAFPPNFWPRGGDHVGQPGLAEKGKYFDSYREREDVWNSQSQLSSMAGAGRTCDTAKTTEDVFLPGHFRRECPNTPASGANRTPVQPKERPEMLCSGPGLDRGPDRGHLSVRTRLAPREAWTTKAALKAFEPIGSERRASSRHGK
jgi:hypothetical protein